MNDPRAVPQRGIEQVAAAHRPGAEEAGVALTVHLEETSVRVEADPLRLRQALGNLVSNAVRHTPAGGRVDLRARPVDGDVVWEVADTGEGISPEHLPHGRCSTPVFEE